jgi:preprotein translocase subunit Sss1
MTEEGRKEFGTMAKVTIGFGAVLVVLGVCGFVATGSVHPTALIPTWFGLAMAIAGALAITEDAKRRMAWMHVAVTVGLVGFLGAAIRAIVEVAKAHGAPLAHPVAVEDQIAMAAICLVFVLLCVRSFIAVRRSRKIAA